MARAKRGTKLRSRHNKLRKRSEGMVHGLGKQIARTQDMVDRAFRYAFRDRRVKKRDFRALWISRLSAASYANDISYSRLICALKKANVKLDRKVLSDIAIEDPAGFTAIVNDVRSHAPTQ